MSKLLPDRLKRKMISAGRSALFIRGPVFSEVLVGSWGVLGGIQMSYLQPSQMGYPSKLHDRDMWCVQSLGTLPCSHVRQTQNTHINTHTHLFKQRIQVNGHVLQKHPCAQKAWAHNVPSWYWAKSYLIALGCCGAHLGWVFVVGHSDIMAHSKFTLSTFRRIKHMFKPALSLIIRQAQSHLLALAQWHMVASHKTMGLEQLSRLTHFTP